MIGNYIVITPTGEESGEGYKTAILAVFDTYEDIVRKEPKDVWVIDSFMIVSPSLIHCDFEPNGNGIRMWAINHKLAADKSFGPSISVI
jgi:hypothetical protein